MRVSLSKALHAAPFKSFESRILPTTSTLFRNVNMALSEKTSVFVLGYPSSPSITTSGPNITGSKDLLVRDENGLVLIYNAYK